MAEIGSSQEQTAQGRNERREILEVDQAGEQSTV